MKIGTSYFISRRAAEKYYKDYDYDDVKSAVDRKLSDGEIHIGKPDIKAGERLEINNEGRYVILTD